MSKRPVRLGGPFLKKGVLKMAIAVTETGGGKKQINGKAPLGMAAMRPVNTTPTSASTGAKPEFAQTVQKQTTGSSKESGGGGSYNNAAAELAAKQAMIDALMAQAEGQYTSQQEALNGYKTKNEADLLAMLERQKAQEEAARVAAEENYRKTRDENINSTNEAYKGIFAGLDSNLQQQLGALQSGYDQSSGQVNETTAKSLQNAFIQAQLAQRNIGQQMAALGRSGGAAESTLLSMANNYGNNRNELEVQRNTDLAQLLQQLTENKTAANTAYTTEKNSKNEALAQELAGLNADYTNSLAGWDADSLNRKSGYETSYNENTLKLQQWVQEQLLAAQQALMEQKAALLAGF